MFSLPDVLIIDGHVLVADAARRALERHAVARCEVASTRDDAMIAMRNCLPDLVVLDFELDVTNSVLDFIAELRETWHLPVVVFSSRSDAHYWQMISRVRPEAVLTKPVGPAKLAMAVRKVFDAERLRDWATKENGQKPCAQGFIDSMVEVVVATDLAGRVTMVNHGGIIVGEAVVDSLIGKPVDEVLGLVSREGNPIALAESARTAAGVLRWSACEGRLGEIWMPGELEVLLAPMPGSKGGIAGMLVVVSPTEAWYAERASVAINGNEKNWRSVFQSIGRGVMVADYEGKVVYLNPIALRLLGLNIDLTLGLRLNEMLPDTEWHRVGDPEVKNGLEVFRLRASGSSRVLELVASPFGDGTIIFPSDVTRMIEDSEQQIRESRLGDLGSIARGLAHELNNQLTVVGGALESVDSLPRDGVEGELLRSAKAAARRAADVVRQMEVFAKPEPGRNEPFDFSELIVALQNRFPDLLKLDGDIPAVTLTGDREQMTMALVNVIQNGVQALRGVELQEIYLRSQWDDEGLLRVVIRDHGCGISAENLHKVIEPYFSTRHEENAIGLGLTVSERIVCVHKGTLDIRSELGSFTEVTITLAAELSPEREESKASAASPPLSESTAHKGTHRGRILILEDEPAVGGVLSIALQRDGWDVDLAVEGAEAISKWRDAYESGSRYNLLISDLTIPGGMGGREAVENIQRFDPLAVALASSGYSDDPVMERPHEFGFVDAVPKPYELKHMLDTVRRCAKLS